VRVAFIAVSQVPSRTANSIRVMKVCQAFSEIGHQVHLWLPRTQTPFDWAEAREHYGLRREFPVTFVGGWPALRRWDASLRGARAAMRWGADVYYVWPYQAAAFLSLLGRPTLLEVHDRPSGIAGPLLFRLFLRGSGLRRILPITESLRVALENDYRVTLQPPRTVVLPSGVDIEAYAGLPGPAEARAKLGWPEQFTAAYTGHLYPGRGVELLAELAQRNPRMSFVWAGGEPRDIDVWAARLVERGVGNVRLLGFVSQAGLPMVHAASDVLLMPYARKIAVSSGGDTAAFASPLKVFEYMAAGRAILASDLPVLREVLHDENAVLLPPEDVEAWEAALRSIQDDRGRRQALANRARQEAAAFSWNERARRALDGLT